ncbi:MAG: hypothetical protein FJ215_06245 [Ignavibacteria bacterium]|nr:hypothetical protein [Ignavibacteria bacterium]
MKRSFQYSPAILVIALLISACDQPNSIELVDERASAPLEVLFLKENGDTPIIKESSIDITGLTKLDQEQYAGSILITSVKSDLRSHVEQLSYARILLEDRTTPFPLSGSFGTYSTYPLIDVGKARLDNSDFDLNEWILRIRSTLTTHFVRTGVFYKLGNDGIQVGKPFVFEHNHDYVVEAEGRGVVKPFIMDIRTPGRMTLEGLSSRTVMFRDEDLVLRWQGKAGSLVQVIFSTYNKVEGRAAKGLMLLKANPVGNSLVVSSSLLRLLPESSDGEFLVSVVSANRKTATIEGFPHKVLVQAATIQNFLVTLR